MSFEIIYSRTNSDQPVLSNVKQFLISDDHESSAVLSDILSLDNITNEELDLCRQWVFIYECAVRHIHNMDTFATGSRIDCSSSPGSDEDQMIQIKNTEVTTERDGGSSESGNVLVMDTNNCAPGYTFLRTYKLSPNLQRHETKACLESCLKFNGYVGLSSDLYIKYHMGMIADMDKYSPPSFHAGDSIRHGPCVMLSYSKHKTDSDMGIGLRCSSWPKEANEWVTRKRGSNWPNQALIDKIKTMPCHVLPVGYPNSENCHLEWRFAFVLPERELIWNFNDVQIQCYTVFKTLKKEITDEIAPDEINSFHLKTIVFWLSERIVNWDRSHLIDHVKTCLSFLNSCIQQRHLAHYFLRSRNLFAGKLEDENTRGRLSTEILRILERTLESFLNCEWRYKYENKYLLSLRLMLQKKPQIDFHEVAREVLDTKDKKSPRNKYTHARCLSMEVTLSVMFLQTNVERLLKIAEDITDDLKDKLMGIYALKFLSIRVGMLYLVEAKKTADSTMRQKLVSEAKWCFETGLEHDVLAATMYLLTYHYQARNYKVIGKFLSEFFSRRLAVPYKGTPGLVICGNRSFLSPDMDETVCERDMVNENDIAFDVVFGCDDLSCVPPALQYECALLDGRYNWFFCSINPLVYVCYIEFQVAFNLKDLEQMQLVVERLRKMVLYVENGKGNLTNTPIELHRNYNILGYCYYVLHDVMNALKWFVKSLEACPTIGNAASYHLCILLYFLGFPNFIIH